ncbi:MAG: fused MFS/spermidine synthase [Alphaproteobacteria bacterium]|nr:fused MFS/spermidine synthase [Alphaproteobacteria bacterium]
MVLSTAALLISAVLLFAVQPMFTKMVLPLLGGAPAVRNTAMLFFQTMLLAGYGYAHLATRSLGPRAQLVLHLAIMGVAAATLPIAVAAGATPPADGAPVPWLIGLFAVSVGLPFFALSANAPLLQRWFAASGHPAAADPYFLYGASNLGGIMALLGYPVLIEPLLRLQAQAWLWTLGYALLTALIAILALMLWRRGRGGQDSPPHPAAASAAGAAVTWRLRLHWLILAFAPSSLLLGVTAHITTDVAAVPLLWVLPLALYLLTFVIAFARRPALRHHWLVKAQPFVVLPVTLLFWWDVRIPALFIILHLAAFFVTAMVCHGELIRRRPASRDLTQFYLWIALGGMMGSAFNVLVAPVVFESVLEFPLALVLACALRPVLGRGRGPALAKDLAFPALLLAAFAVPPLAFDFRMAVLGPGIPEVAGAVLYFVSLGMLAYGFRLRPLRFGLGVGVVLTVSALTSATDDVIARERSFFGVHRVKVTESGAFTLLQHGTAIHGAQHTEPEFRRDPLTYYQADGPLGQIFAVLGEDVGDVGILGLGAGTMACYRRPGQSWTFFEIDPVVARIARDRRFFHYMADCAPDASVVLGDGRLSLEAVAEGRFDLLIVDVFSSDSVPLHLITRQALDLYMTKLAADGLVLVHISNRHLDFAPVLANLAADAGLDARQQAYQVAEPDYLKTYKFDSHWVVIARPSRGLADLDRNPAWRPLAPDPGTGVWTDDYSNILSAIKLFR